jgi:putative copper resistance protein D
MMAAADPDSLLTVLHETSFAQVWLGRLVLAAVLLVQLLRRGHEHHGRWAKVLLAGILVASLALVGHTQASDGRLWLVHMAADSCHLLAAGAWFGGLIALGYLLALARRLPSAQHAANAVAALVRFSGMGYAAVAILVGSGGINAWLMVGSAANLFNAPYGQLLMAKVALLGGMLVLAAHNRFRLVPAVQRQREAGMPAEFSLQALRRNVIGEQILALAILLVVGWLGTMQPAIAASG